jgi:glycosyltransferase involved in cell wall biosynthesis
MPRLLIVANEAAMMRDFLNPLARHFRARGWQVDAMACDVRESPDCRGVYNHLWNVEWSRNPLAATNWLRAPQTVRAVVTANQYDLIHVHTPIPAFVTRYALRRWRTRTNPKIIYTAHGFHFHDRGGFLKNLIFRSLERIGGRWTDSLVVINRADEHAARRHRLVAPGKLMYMPGIGIDLSYYDARTVNLAEIAGVRRELRLSDGQPLVTMLAEFTANKRHCDALEAFAAWNHPTARLAFAGYGPLMESVRRLAESHGVANRVSFLGFRRDIPALIRASTMVILPSLREGLPRSVMEALALETPVVGTDIRGTRDLLSEGAGLLVQPRNTKQLSEAMAWVTNYPEEARAMARRGRSRISEYDLDRILCSHEQLYNSLLRDVSGRVLSHSAIKA